jgi:hypothetical protein
MNGSLAKNKTNRSDIFRRYPMVRTTGYFRASHAAERWMQVADAGDSLVGDYGDNPLWLFKAYHQDYASELSK